MNRDSEFWVRLDRASGFALVNLLWVVCSAPIITMPAATAGVFAVMADGVRGRESEPLQRFFTGMRRYWRKSSLIALIDIVLVGLVVFNLAVLTIMDVSVVAFVLIRGVTLFVGIMILAVNLYIWSLLVMYDLPLRDLVEISLKLVFKHTAWSALLLGASIIVLLIGVFVLPVLFMLFIVFSGWVWLVNKGAWHVIRQYQDELEDMSPLVPFD